MAVNRRSATAGGAFLFAVLAAACGVRADPVIIISSPADYEPRLEEPLPAGNGSYTLNNIDDLNPVSVDLGDGNIDTPTDAATLRVGGQSRHKMNAALFFLLPQSASVQTIAGAHLRLTQTAIGGTPSGNADLWAVGTYSGISVNNDFDDPKVTPTIQNGTDVNTGLASLLYLEANAETNPAGLNTSVPRRKVGDNFLLPTDAVTTGTAVRDTNAATDAALVSYLNDLYGSTAIGPDTYLVLRLNVDTTVLSTANNQYRFFSGNEAVEANRPTLTLDVVVPEPASASLLAVAGAALLARRRRRA